MIKKVILIGMLFFSVSAFSERIIPAYELKLSAKEQAMKDKKFMEYFIQDKPKILATLKSVNVARKQVTWGEGCYIFFNRTGVQINGVSYDSTELHINAYRCEEDIWPE